MYIYVNELIRLNQYLLNEKLPYTFNADHVISTGFLTG